MKPIVDIYRIDLSSDDVTAKVDGILRKAAARPDFGFAVFEFGSDHVFPNRLVPVIALIDNYWTAGVKAELIFPDDGYVEKACERIKNGTWDAGKCSITGNPFDSVWRFSDGEGVCRIVNALVLQLRRSTVLGAGFVDSITWCLNEVMDNVLNHSAPQGNACGYVMVQYVPRSGRLNVCVCDWGIGILKSFEASSYNPQTTEDAIRLALSQGVTRDRDVGQGNGLWGLAELIKRAKGGRLLIQSGNGVLRIPSPAKGKRPRQLFTPIDGPYPGTVVDFQLSCSADIPFESVFPEMGRLTDLWVENLEVDDQTVRVVVKEMVAGCGTRVQGRQLRMVLENLIERENKRIQLDFKDVTACSSSFADELLGRLVIRYGFMDFSQRIQLIHTSGLKKGVLNRSIMQRVAEALHR